MDFWRKKADLSDHVPSNLRCFAPSANASFRIGANRPVTEIGWRSRSSSSSATMQLRIVGGLFQWRDMARLLGFDVFFYV